MSMTDIANKTIEVHRILVEISAEDRRRIFVAVAALCGDDVHAVQGPRRLGLAEEERGALHPKAARWIAQNGIASERIGELFHVDGSASELILVKMIGKSRRMQTINCYLLSGIRSLLVTGVPTLADADAVALCKKYKCHDAANHPTYRKEMANLIAGDKKRGFVLSAPGLGAAAEVLKAGK
jgi:hypothetical protein